MREEEEEEEEEEGIPSLTLDPFSLNLAPDDNEPDDLHPLRVSIRK